MRINWKGVSCLYIYETIGVQTCAQIFEQYFKKSYENMIHNTLRNMWIRHFIDTSLPWECFFPWPYDIVQPFENPVSCEERADCRQIQIYKFSKRPFKNLPYCATHFFENDQKR